ncbi:MAG: VOC family protein [Proteobacteria bacterium]|nr:VOC family protein [Pseudomonadota bacterium]
MERRVSLITLGVADLVRARMFYEQLGFKASSIGGGAVVFLQAGPMAICLWPRSELAADAGVADAPAGFRGVAVAHNVRTTEEVDATLAEAERAGARITRPAHDADWGGRSGYFADPDGHLWEVAWNPHFPLSDDGALTLPQ